MNPGAFCRQLRDLSPLEEPETTKQIGREAATEIERLYAALVIISQMRGQPSAADVATMTIKAGDQHVL